MVKPASLTPDSPDEPTGPDGQGGGPNDPPDVRVGQRAISRKASHSAFLSDAAGGTTPEKIRTNRGPRVR